jgi:hypothetical protein
MRQKAGGSVGGFSTVGYHCSTSSPLAASPTYGGHLPTTADESSSFMPKFLILIISRITTLLMSDELAQEDEDAEDYDLEAIEHRTDLRRRDDDEATLVGGRGAASMNEDAVVFEIGDEDAHDLSDDDDAHKSRRASIEHTHEGDDHADERVGFLNGGPRSRHRDD